VDFATPIRRHTSPRFAPRRARDANVYTENRCVVRARARGANARERDANARDA
jgi:hypothetical protein